MSALPHIYADFHNADAKGRLRLNCVGTVNDLSRQQVQLHEGLSVLLYSDDDADENGRPARLVSEGAVAYSQEEQCWVAVIDWQKLIREGTDSPSEVQRDDNAAVILGSKTNIATSARSAGR